MLTDNMIEQSANMCEGGTPPKVNQSSDLFEYVPVPYFALDTGGRLLAVNNALSQLLGQAKGALCGATLANFIAPASREAYQVFLSGLEEHCINTTIQLELSFLRHGVVVPAALHFRFDPENRCILGAAFDQMEQKRLTDKLQEEAMRYQIIAQQSSDILFEYFIDEDRMVFSHKYQALTGNDPEVTGFRASILRSGMLHPDEINLFKSLFAQINDHRTHICGQLRLRMRGGEFVWYKCEGTILYENGRAYQIVGAASNVDALVREREALLYAAETDSLTKLYNKQATQTKIEEFLAQEGRDGSHALFIIDVDNFKNLNDRLGHLFGDAVLAEISAGLRYIGGPGNILGRIGGDEFILFAKNASAAQAEQMGQRICRMAQTVCHSARSGCTVSASVGASLYPSDADTYLHLFRTADVALYNAKLSKKNCCHLYSRCASQPGEEIALNNEYRKAEPSVERRYTNVLLDMQIIELFCNGKNTEKTIPLALSILGSFYQTSHACIMELTPGSTGSLVTYEWYLQPGDTRMQPLHGFTRDMLLSASRLFGRDGILCCYDISMLQKTAPEVYRLMEETGIHSTLQCALIEDGYFQGILALHDYNEGRVWGYADRNSLMLTGKNIGRCLFKFRAQQANAHFADCDLLTKVWNLNQFTLAAGKALQKPGKRAVVSVDIQRFRMLNELVGYAKGDAILMALSQSLQSRLRPGELIARVSGDVFVLLLSYEGAAGFGMRLWQMMEAASALVLQSGEAVKLTLFTGVYLVKQSTLNVSSYMDKANLARKQAKRNHKSTITYFDEAMERTVMQIRLIEDHMEQALANRDFFVVFQPKFNLLTGRVTGAEALIRWNSKEHGVLYPDVFVPVLEKNGFIVDIDLFVLEEACKFLARWKDTAPELTISVNFSRMHAGRGDSLPRALQILQKWKVPANRIEIEITESAFMQDGGMLKKYVELLRSNGLCIAMDDFGAGYSSLSAFTALPVDVLKLDRGFLERHNSERERIVIGSIIRMAHELGVRVVSEGVELPEQRDMMREIGCDWAQGYLFAKPQPPEAFEQFMVAEFGSINATPAEAL